jgi:hypothetical protein
VTNNEAEIPRAGSADLPSDQQSGPGRGLGEDPLREMVRAALSHADLLRRLRSQMRTVRAQNLLLPL